MPSALFQKLFKERFPSVVRRIITASSSCNLDELARRADFVMKEERSEKNNKDLFKRRPSVSSPANETALGGLIGDLTLAVNKLVDAGTPTRSYVQPPHILTVVFAHLYLAFLRLPPTFFLRLGLIDTNLRTVLKVVFVITTKGLEIEL